MCDSPYTLTLGFFCVCFWILASFFFVCVAFFMVVCSIGCLEDPDDVDAAVITEAACEIAWATGDSVRA